jgi:hypothetical protein
MTRCGVLVAIVGCVAACSLGGCGRVSAVAVRAADVSTSARSGVSVADRTASSLKVKADRLVRRLDHGKVRPRRRLSARAVRVLVRAERARPVPARSAVTSCVRVLESRLKRTRPVVPARVHVRSVPAFASPSQVRTLVSSCMTDPASASGGPAGAVSRGRAG